jgi:long-chain acyl-CoA synthetase
MNSLPTDTASLFAQLDAPDARSAVFLQGETRRITYSELFSTVKKLGSLFAENGLREGDRVVLSVADDAETALLFLALLRHGLTAVLLDPETKPERARALLQTAQPAGFIADEAFFDRLNLDRTAGFSLVVKPAVPAKGGLFRKLLGRPDAAPAPTPDTYPALLATLPEADRPVAVSPDTIAYVLFTSGTTADPKGVQISHRALLAHLQTLSRVYGLSADSRLLNNLLLYHADGLVQGPVLAAFNRATWVRPLPFDISRVGDLLDGVYKHRVSHFVAVPAVLALLLRFGDGYEDAFRAPDFRCVISVSAHLEEALWRSFAERFGVRLVNVYGLTETIAGGLFAGPDAATGRPGTVGLPVDMEARVVDTAGRDVPEGEEGELLLRGGNLMSGYLRNPAATAAVLRAGWLYTGDAARRDPDGLYRITGRLKNLVISGGVTIHPEEVTEVLHAHPAVAGAVSLGLPDAVFGERLVGAVVLKPGYAVAEAELIAHCRARLEEKKVPTAIYQFDALPQNPNGKVQLQAVREQLARQVRTAPAPATDYHELVRAAAARAFNVPAERLRPEDSSRTVAGWDSLAHLDFVVRLEGQLGVQFDPAEIMRMNSLQTAEEILRQKHGAFA